MTNDREILIAKLMKIRSLANGGVAGERKAAQAMLSKLMRQHGIEDSELDSSEAEVHVFKLLRNGWHPKLAAQIGYSVLGVRDFRVDKKRSRLYITCSNHDAVEISAKLDFYTNAYQEDLAIFHRAFVNKNSLFPPEEMDAVEDGDESLLPKMTEEEREKIIKMMRAVDKRHYYQQLEESV